MTRYALEHTDTAGATHRWTVSDLSAHWVARWLALDSGREVAVLRDDGDGWQTVTTWYPDGGHDPVYAWAGDEPDGQDPDDPEPAEPEAEPERDRPVIDYAAL